LEDVLTFWDLDRFQLQALGIVSGNDYSKNQPGFGIYTNKKELKKLWKEKTTKCYITSFASGPWKILSSSLYFRGKKGTWIR
jgi:hypothetical protein